MSESIVERRLRYIERQKKLGHGVNVSFEGMTPEGSGPPNRHGMPVDRDDGSGEHYTTNLPLARALDDDVLLVHTWEGTPLPREHGGPCRMITPRLYAWKGTKWIRRIEFLDRNRRGFWERRGYSDTAEPWFNDRYS